VAKDNEDVQTTISIKTVKSSLSDMTKVKAGFDTLAQGTKGISSALSKVGGPAGAAVAAFGAITAGLGALTLGLAKATQAVHQLGMRGGDVSAVQQAFERIASPTTLTNLQNATGHLLTNVELQREYIQVFRSGLVDSEEEIARFYRAVTRGAQDTEESTTDMLKSLGDALTSGETGVFTRLGINVQFFKDQLSRAGVSAESSAGKARLLNMILGELERTTEGIDNSAGNMNDTFTRTNVALENMTDTVARNISESTDMVATWDAINEALGVFEVTGESVGQTIGSLVRTIVQGMIRISVVGLEVINGIRSTVLSSFEFIARANEIIGFDTAAAAWQRQVDSLNDWGMGIQTTINFLNDLNAAIDANAAAREAAASASSDGLRRASPNRQISNRPGERSSVAPSGGLDLIPATPDMELFHVREQIDAMEDLMEMTDEFDQLEQRIREAQTEHATFMETHEEKMAMVAEERVGLMEQQIEAGEKYKETLEKIDETNQNAMDTSVGAVVQFGTSLASILGQVAAAQDENTKKAEVYKKVQGGILAGISFVRAAMEIAEIPAAFPNVAEMVTHGLSAAAHIAAGVMAITQLGGSGTPPSTAAASFTPRESEAVEEQGPRGEGSRIEIYTMGLNSARLGRELENARSDYQRSGLEPSMSGAGEFGQ
jgi:hypothetical protein